MPDPPACPSIAVLRLPVQNGNGGHPAWWLNLEANPEAVIRLPHQQPRRVRARLATGGESERLWQRWLAIEPENEVFADGRAAEIAVVVFEPPEV